MRPAPNKYTTHIRLAEVEVVAANALTEAKRAYALAESKQQVGPPGERGLQGARGKDAIGERGPKGEPGQSIRRAFVPYVKNPYPLVKHTSTMHTIV
jgi:hypothetical protein